jgi:hypothetical protein
MTLGWGDIPALDVTPQVGPHHDRAEAHCGDEPIETRRRRGDFDPAHIPLRSPLRQRPIPRSSRRRSPEAPGHARESPQRHPRKVLVVPGIPAYPRSASKRQDRPVTPEVAGSSPVAPVKVPANRHLLTPRDRRLFAHPAQIPHANRPRIPAGSRS